MDRPFVSPASGGATPPRTWRALLRETLARRAPAAGLALLARRAREVERAAGVTHTGRAATCCRTVSGPVFAAAREAVGVVRTRRVHLVHWEWDVDGNQWALLEGPSLDRLSLAALDIERTLASRGFGSLPEWTVFGLEGEGSPQHLVYGHRRDTFHPFAPRDGQLRDEAAEQAMAGALAGLLPVEGDPAQWTPLWGVPVGGGSGA